MWLPPRQARVHSAVDLASVRLFYVFYLQVERASTIVAYLCPESVCQKRHGKENQTIARGASVGTKLYRGWSIWDVLNTQGYSILSLLGYFIDEVISEHSVKHGFQFGIGKC